MVVAILVVCVLNTLFSFLVLAALGRIVVESRDFHDEFLGAVKLFLHVASESDAKIQSALDCLLHTDAQFDALQNPDETRAAC
jgi:hypothetical protein